MTQSRVDYNIHDWGFVKRNCNELLQLLFPHLQLIDDPVQTVYNNNLLIAIKDALCHSFVYRDHLSIDGIGSINILCDAYFQLTIEGKIGTLE